MSEPFPPEPGGRADVWPGDGAQDVPQDPGSIVDTEVPEEEEVTDDDR